MAIFCSTDLRMPPMSWQNLHRPCHTRADSCSALARLCLSLCPPCPFFFSPSLYDGRLGSHAVGHGLLRVRCAGAVGGDPCVHVRQAGQPRCGGAQLHWTDSCCLFGLATESSGASFCCSPLPQTSFQVRSNMQTLLAACQVSPPTYDVSILHNERLAALARAIKHDGLGCCGLWRAACWPSRAAAGGWR